MGKQLEAIEEVKFFNWVRREPNIYPYIWKIPNEGKRSIQTAQLLKRQGMRSGVLDCFCMIAKEPYHGLFIEFKIKPNTLTDNQKKFLNDAQEQSYKCVIVYSAEEAIEELKRYLNIIE